jgi:hypothetical protein
VQSDFVCWLEVIYRAENFRRPSSSTWLERAQFVRGEEHDNAERAHAFADSDARPLKLIVLMRKGQQLPVALDEVTVIYRPDLLTSESEDFALTLIATLNRVLPSDRDSQLDEARRLLKVKEYRAAIVSAVTYLEVSCVV